MKLDFRGKAKGRTQQEKRRPTVVRSTSELMGRRGSFRKSFPFGNVFGFGPRMTCMGEVHVAVSISLHKVVAEIISIMSLTRSLHTRP